MTLPAPAALIIRAVLRDPADAGELDAWYHAEHLPEAFEVFGAVRASRWWSFDEEPAPVHYAMYEFASPDALEAAMSGAAIQGLIAGFTERWGDRLARVRSRAAIAQELRR